MKLIYDQIWEFAMRKLEIRLHSKSELVGKLYIKFPNDRGTILKVIEEMERVQLLNDQRFAEQYLSHLISKPIGRVKIMMEAQKRGLSTDLVENVLATDGWSEYESISDAFDKKNRVLSEKDDWKRKRKIINFLKNRGFNNSLIYKIIEEKL